MGKAALVTVVGFLVMGAIYSLNANRSALATEGRVVDYQYETLAKNAAQVGHERAEKELAEQARAESFMYKSFDGEYEGIPYDVTISWSDSVATVESKGIAADGRGNDVSYTLRSKYEAEEVSAGVPEIKEEAPGWFLPALAAEGNLDLGGNSDAEIYADGDDADKLNANMHTNGNFTARGNADVRGFVTSVGTAELKGNADVDPNYNPDDADAVQQGVDRVEIPAFDATKYLDKMGGADDTFGDLKYSANGSYDYGGTREDPYIIYVKDDLDISGNVDFSGYVMFIVEDEVRINGNSDLTGTSDYDGGDESNIAIYGGGNATLDLTGNAELYGQIFVGGDVELAGNGTVYGNIVTRGALSVTGNADILYRKPSPSLTRVWEDPDTVTQVKLVAHNEW